MLFQKEVMYYKQTFLFLLMELFRYRYRQDHGTRDAHETRLADVFVYNICRYVYKRF